MATRREPFRSAEMISLRFPAETGELSAFVLTIWVWWVWWGSWGSWAGLLIQFGHSLELS